MNRFLLLTVLAFTFFGLNAQEVTVDIQNSANGCGLATDCSNNFVCYDITATVDVNKNLDSYNIWVSYDNTVISRISNGADATCVIADGGDTDLEASISAYRVGGIPSSPYPMVANNPTVVHTICFEILDLSNFNGTIITVGGDKFSGALKTTVTFDDSSFDDDVPESDLVVNPSNSECLFEPPVITENPQITNEDTPITFCPTISDPNTGDTLTVSICGAPANGTALTAPGNCITYTPNPNYNGPDMLCVQVCDQTGLCDSVAVPITVNPVNDPPVALNDNNFTPEDTPIDIPVFTNDSDPLDALGTIDPTSVMQVNPPFNGTTSVNPTTGVVTYTPNTDFNGLDTFTYVICDNGIPLPPLCDTAEVVILVTPVNDPPIAVDDADSTPEDTPITISVVGNDDDPSDPLGNINPSTVSEVTSPNNGLVSVNPVTGEITYTPNPNFNGMDTFTYVVCDDGNPLPALCDTAEVIITVTPLNDPPSVSEVPQNTPEDTPITFCPIVSDPDMGDLLTVSSCSTPNNGSVSIAPGNCITYTPEPNFNGLDSVCVVVCDNGSPQLCDSIFVPITVIPVNDAPIANDDNETTPEDTPITIDVTVNDNDDLDPLGNIDPTSVADVSAPSNGTVDYTTTPGMPIYVPNPGYNGIDSFQYVVCDDGNPLPALCDTATVVITVNPVNDAPTISENPQSTAEDTPVTFCPTTSDPDTGDILTISSCGAPLNGTASFNDPIDGCITYTPNPNYNGFDSVCVVVCDNGTPILCDSMIVPIRIFPVNDAPFAVNDSVITDEDIPVDIVVLANDDDPFDPLGNIDPTSVAEVTPPTNGVVSIDPLTGVITYTPNLDFNGNDSFQYAMCDDGNPLAALCDTATVFITINPVQDCDSLVVDVFLEGNFNGTDMMSTLLNEYHLLPGQNPAISSNPGAQFLGVAAPVGQPYNIAPWNHMGSEGDLYGDTAVGAVSYSSTVVDWVLLSVRANNVNAASEMWKCAALLHNDGSVEVPDSCACLALVDATDYYIVVEHRNHLAVMSQAVQKINGSLTFDFTTNDSWKLDVGSPNEASQKQIGSNFVMYGGNGNQNSGRTDINSADNAIWINDFGTIFLYQFGDHTLDADVNSVDRSLWLPNNGFFNLIQF